METIDREEVDEVCALAEAGAPEARIALSRLLLKPIEQEAAASCKSACHKGCDHCCHLRIEAYDFELDTLYTYVTTVLDSQQQQRIRTAIAERFPIVEGLSDQQQRMINVRCPFLAEGVCSVYPVRPMSCAGYHSCDASVCQRSNADPTDTSFGIPQDPAVGYMKMRQMALVQMALDLSYQDEQEIISGMHQRLFSHGSVMSEERP